MDKADGAPELPDELSSGPTLDEEQIERGLIHKIDLHILPFVVLLYLFSFLDRGRDAEIGYLTHPSQNRPTDRESQSTLEMPVCTDSKRTLVWWGTSIK